MTAPRPVSPDGHQHLVQFYGTDSLALARCVGRYLWGGLKQGQGVVAIATPEHSRAITRELNRLGADLEAAAHSGRIVLLDAGRTLSRFLVEGWPDADLFEATIGPVIRELHAHSSGGCRAYGEMVGILWDAGQLNAAVHLERLWNELIPSTGLALMCGYPIDVFDDRFERAAIGEILEAHTEVIPCDESGDLITAIDRASWELLGERAGRLRLVPDTNGRRPGTLLPRAENAILALRSESPNSAAQVMARAREHYRAERRFRALVENSTDGIALLDPQGNVGYASPAIFKVLGYETADFCGRNIFDLVHPEHLSLFERSWREAEENPRSPLPIEGRLRHKNGEWRWIEGVLSNFVSDPDVAAVVFNHRDITARKLASQMEERLREAAKLESLGILAGGIAHDFNNLLTGILGGASMLLEELSPSSPLFGMAETIVQSGERAAQLTRQMLAYSGRGNFVIEPLNLSSQVREILSLLHASVPKHVQIATDLDESGAAIEADAGQLQQLVMNLVINAAEAIGREGIVAIRTRLVRLEQPSSSLAGELVPGEYVSLRVQDNGVGMDESTRSRIFDPFFTTKFTGRGLGLAAVLGIIRAHHGGIEVQSEPGKGSVFTVFFPVLKGQRATPAAVSATTPFARAGATVLVADDEQIVLNTATSALEHQGFRVLPCAGGRAAIDHFARLHSEISLVILDMTMPGLSGEETLARLRNIDSAVPVLISSGYSEDEARKRFGSEIAGFLQKPYTVQRLSDAAVRYSRQFGAAASSANPGD